MTTQRPLVNLENIRKKVWEKNKNKNYVHSITKLHVPIIVDYTDMIMTKWTLTVNVKEK